MKIFRNSLIIIIIAALLSAAAPFSASALEEPELLSVSAILTDLHTDRVFFSVNADMKAYPASLTKIMTVLLAVEAVEDARVSLQDEVTVSENIMFDLEEDGSTAGIRPGETMTLEGLLYCAMLVSANEACNAIAEYIGGGIPEFIDMMNSKAAALGCAYTRFQNTHGLPNEEHYTTARDLSVISKEAMSRPLFADICNTKTKIIPATNLSEQRELFNTNALLHRTQNYPDYEYEYARGIKTGYTSAAGYCLASTAEKNDVFLIAVVMGGPSLQNDDGTVSHGNFADSITLYEWVFNNFSYREILRSSELVAEVPVLMASGTDSLLLRPESSVSALVPNDTEDGFEREIIIYSERDGYELRAPIEAGTVLGEVRIFSGGETFGAVKLTASTSVSISRVRHLQNQLENTWEQTWVRGIFWSFILLLAVYAALVIRYNTIKKKRRRAALAARRSREATEAGANTKVVFQKEHNRGQNVRTARSDMQSGKPEEAKENKPEERDYFEEFFKK
ncbi:MAG: D-alanyl-D-alanine carboxypeptidase [Oscillospiraceae bacterium]|nr:D-alanyl-D-alanine carboxypeptidase [Oscillospiraceae bacterium]